MRGEVPGLGGLPEIDVVGQVAVLNSAVQEKARVELGRNGECLKGPNIGDYQRHQIVIEMDGTRRVAPYQRRWHAGCVNCCRARAVDLC